MFQPEVDQSLVSRVLLFKKFQPLVETTGMIRTFYSMSQRGFTLVELLVVIAIIGILAAFAVANFRAGEKSSALSLGAEQIAGAFREAQNLAVSQKRINGEVPPAFGVYFQTKNKTTYKVFADNGLASPGNYENDDTLIGNVRDIPNYVVIESILSTATSELSVLFAPPSGKVSFGDTGASINSDENGVIIKLDGSEKRKKIIVNAFTGAVNISDVP